MVLRSRIAAEKRVSIQEVGVCLKNERQPDGKSIEEVRVGVRVLGEPGQMPRDFNSSGVVWLSAREATTQRKR